ncbi:hypothetical protein ACSHXN_45410 (plasmid) [Streptomyces sp. HUAS TT11]|uniref:hypothetical protein n=1 Tax=Streptomyces sp. HUAS TT11 TaxID=3447508 RepID=UPI003F6552A0
MTEEQHQEAAAKRAGVWSRLGFEPFEDSVHVLDCHLQHTQDLPARRQEEFAALCRSWYDPHRLQPGHKAASCTATGQYV